MLEHSLWALLRSERLAGVVVALHPQDDRAQRLGVFEDARVTPVVGGEQRSDSVLAALVALQSMADARDWVLVHDAARPCLPAADLALLIQRVTSSGTGGILATPVVDTVKEANRQGRVSRTLDRSRLWRAQTPQMFRLGELRAALENASSQGLAITDEASAMELAGHAVQLVSGSVRNLKVTEPEDLQLAQWYLSNRIDR